MTNYTHKDDSGILAFEIPDSMYQHEVNVMPKNLYHSVPDSNLPAFEIYNYVGDQKLGNSILAHLRVLIFKRYADNDSIIKEEKETHNPIFLNIPINLNDNYTYQTMFKKKRKRLKDESIHSSG